MSGLHGSDDPAGCDLMSSKRSSQRSRRDSSANRTSVVLSRRAFPPGSVSEDSSRAWAMMLAVPGDPTTSRVSPLRPIGRGCRRGSAGAARRTAAAGRPPPPPRRRRRGRSPRDLDEPELGDVTADRRLGHREAALDEALGKLLLAGDRLEDDDFADRPLALPLRCRSCIHPHLPPGGSRSGEFRTSDR